MKALPAIFFFLFSSLCSYSQGRVVINELMPWSGCSTTSEFIELLNFGPGPMNIGCYIVTNGQYSVTIPANTVIQPGQYYLLSGQNTLAQNCGNVDSAVTVNLNWNTCNCTNTPIPTTGDGFLKDGGSANEKIVLLDPNLAVVDAVSRDLPVSSSMSITTSSNGGCPSKTFNLDNMGISYETIGISTGKDNSYSRKVDGDCGWAKTPQISAKGPNKAGSTSSATYTFTTLTASDCQSTEGKISITVAASNVSALFPMNYVLAFDADSNGVFNDSDVYKYGIDSAAPNIDITNLKYGRYKITVGSSMGCNLKTFDFFIFNCYGVVLPVNLVTFELVQSRQLRWSFKHAENIQYAEVEGSYDGSNFHMLYRLTPSPNTDNSWSGEYTIQPSAINTYRLKITTTDNNFFYSPVIKQTFPIPQKAGIWPNPAGSQVNASFTVPAPCRPEYTIFDTRGKIAARGILQATAGLNTLSIPTNQLIAGYYRLAIGLPGEKDSLLAATFIKK